MPAMGQKPPIRAVGYNQDLIGDAGRDSERWPRSGSFFSSMTGPARPARSARHPRLVPPTDFFHAEARRVPRLAQRRRSRPFLLAAQGNEGSLRERRNPPNPPRLSLPSPRLRANQAAVAEGVVDRRPRAPAREQPAFSPPHGHCEHSGPFAGFRREISPAAAGSHRHRSRSGSPRRSRGHRPSASPPAPSSRTRA